MVAGAFAARLRRQDECGMNAALPVVRLCLLQTQYGGGLLRPMYCLPQGDFRPAETHRNPSGDQLQLKLAGVTTAAESLSALGTLGA